MQTRPRLVTSIPFWVLLVLSLASVIGGLVIVFQQIDAMQAVLNDPNATVVTVYVAQSWAIVGAAVIGAGAIGLVATLAVAAVVSTRPRADVAVETIDWTSDDESAPFVAAPTVAAAATTAPAAPLVLEDADIETPSNAPAPAEAAAASHDAPKLDTGDETPRA
ncbi:MAG: hypothetical protein BGO45_08205 [Microbacterium sp. 71-36]|uniref:dinucleotide-utilizing enzyme n=1 Tax=unclassified Microbacterium TaxID=2609290 RepID=UPI0008685571|nr:MULTISPECIES: dinucleotide-utilizing enzyme [unclassified Microbacterium]MBN9212703.1 dinucleotide-utilizing enzyme [Microbacterium sp.]ODT39282.1 MAG: hypothetical protein ABS60_06990 [Microbacterium sp. SCN 71-17]OJV76815.1 MAG: hypothetical protein BGO45_08205 [Microbacterium sp. 71-36]